MDAVLLSAVRTPIGKFLGGLSGIAATDLGARCVAEAVRRAGISPDAVDEVILGNVLSAGLGQNPARQAALRGGLPPSVSALTVNKVCGSGLKAVMLAAQAIRAGDIQVAVAGGMESMSRTPHLIPGSRSGYRLGDGKVIDHMVHDGLWDAFNDFHMGETGELVAEKCCVTRQDQDEFAVESHRKAVTAIREGKFKDEIVSVEAPARKGKVEIIETDEAPRENAALDRMARLSAAFRKDGTVTAGNASALADGAAALVVASSRFAKEKGIRPLARITGYATGGVEPKWVMLAPIEAIKKLLAQLDIEISHFDLVEINEAFSSAAVSLQRELGIDPSRLNVHGGAVALGHPIGCTGARILTTLLHAMSQRDARTGLAALCLGGGNAVALSVTRDV
ncbi:MAG: acetyl-CoA C-acetyltransferase [Planctomycetota bacterium]|nr:acetyl-CoA C-acetyltransferase [Planctomycetota bacterium]